MSNEEVAVVSVAAKLLSIADRCVRSLIRFKEASRNASQADKRRIANLFDKVADCVGKIGKSMGRQKIPSAHCSEVYAYSIELPKIMEKYVSRELALELAMGLSEVYETEELALSLKDQSSDQDWKTLVSTAEAAAGKFRAAANILRAA